MASFNDNSGDIILDAVLTEQGRRALARGTFKITSFSLADDEINYAQYNKDHPSGSAYYDLEILQTPIMQGYTLQNVNSQLRTIKSQDLLYMPDIVLNEKTNNTVKRFNEMYYIAANAETADKMKEEMDEKYILRADDPTALPIFMELGLNTPTKSRTAENASSLMKQNNLSDATVDVDFDPTWFSGMLGTSTLEFSNDTAGSVRYNQGALKGGTRPRKAHQKGLMCTTVRTAANKVVQQDNAGFNAVAAASELQGPADSCAVIIPSVDSALKANSSQGTPEAFKKYGKTSETVTGLGGTKKWDSGDACIKISAPNGGGVLDMAVKIIRYSSG
jgi:hypothetical protein